MFGVKSGSRPVADPIAQPTPTVESTGMLPDAAADPLNGHQVEQAPAQYGRAGSNSPLNHTEQSSAPGRNRTITTTAPDERPQRQQLADLVRLIQELCTWQGRDETKDLTNAWGEADNLSNKGDSRAVRAVQLLWRSTQVRHASALLERGHRGEMAKLRPLCEAIETVTKSSADQDPQVRSALTKFTAARRDCGFNSTRRSDQLSDGRERLAKAAWEILHRLDEISVTERLRTEISRALTDSFRGRANAALQFQPKTLKQWQLRQDVIEAWRTWETSIAALERGIAAVDALRNEIARDAVAPIRSNDEKAYLRLYAQYHSRARQHRQLAPRGQTQQERDAFHDTYVKPLSAALLASSARHAALAHDETPGRFTQALESLEEVKTKADALLAQYTGVLEAAVDALSPARHPDRTKRSKDAVNLVNNSADVVLQELSSERQIKLLEALRAAPNLHRTDDFRKAQSKVYRATRLESNFLQAEKALRKEVIESLIRTDKARLQTAQREWSAMGRDEKREVLQLIVAAHCKAADFKKPQDVEISFDVNAAFNGRRSTLVGTWDPESRVIWFRRDGPVEGDLEMAIEAVFHENSHNRQQQLSESIRRSPDEFAQIHPALAGQAALFAANEQFTDILDDSRVSEGPSQPDAYESAYREQPTEAHAFHSGQRFARGLMRALNNLDKS